MKPHRLLSAVAACAATFASPAQTANAAPQLELVQAHWLKTAEGTRPVLEVRNTGLAHGRLDGVLTGKDQSGVSSEWAPIDIPILPGEARKIVLRPLTAAETGAAPPRPVQAPLTLKGALEWGDQRLPIDLTLPP